MLQRIIIECELVDFGSFFGQVDHHLVAVEVIGFRCAECLLKTLEESKNLSLGLS
jgi:hypothetical protein